MSAPRKFRRRQQIVEAMQYDGTPESAAKLVEWGWPHIRNRPRAEVGDDWFCRDGRRFSSFRFADEFEPVDTEPEPALVPVGIEWCETHDGIWRYSGPSQSTRLKFCDESSRLAGLEGADGSKIEPCRFVPLYRKGET